VQFAGTEIGQNRDFGAQRWVSPMTSGNTALAALFFCLAVFPLPGGAHHSHGNYELRDGSDGCLLGFVTPLHGDPERGQGIEKEWD